MARLLIFVFILVISTTTEAQCLHAKYKVATQPTMLSGILPVQLHIMYHVWADSNFIEILGTEDSISSDIPTNFDELKKIPSNEHIIIERATGIGFFINENRYVIVKRGKIMSKEKTGDCLLIQSNEESYIRVCKNISSLMTPGILLDPSENIYGVEAFNSKKSTIKLTSKISASDRKLNYNKLFDQANISEINDTVDFFKN